MVKSKEYMTLYRARGHGTDFETVVKIPPVLGEVKVLVSTHTTQNKLPDKTLAKNRIYAHVDWHTGNISSMFFYDGEGGIKEQWNVGTGGKGHKHFGSTFHTHHGLRHSRRRDSGRALKLSEVYIALKVNRQWRQYAQQNSQSLRRRLGPRGFDLSWTSST